MGNYHVLIQYVSNVYISLQRNTHLVVNIYMHGCMCVHACMRMHV